jgi:hypothetical protein
MIVQIADHPLVVFCLLVVSLPELVASRTLESASAPDPSRLGDRVVQSSLVEDLVDGCVADWLLRIVAQVAFYATWSPISSSSQLEDEFRCGLWGSMDRVGSMRFDAETGPPMFPVDAQPTIDCSLIDP